MKVNEIENMTEDDLKILRPVDHPTRYKPQPKVKSSSLDFDMLIGKPVDQDLARRIIKSVSHPEF